MLEVRDLRWPGGSGFTFRLDPGEILCISGPSGSGKSRLLRALADLDAAEGDAVLSGRRRGDMPGPDWRARVRYCAAEPAWWAPRVGDHFEEPPDRDELDILGLDVSLLEHSVTETSTGERQRLALLRALQPMPDVLLLDEPTSALDPEATARVEGWLASQVGTTRCAVVVSHDPQQAERLGARRVSLEALTG
ncbi:ABC transporter ATP-binding protein [Pontivivens ytuae]|uniref:ATP-binding cassette domain-containing protein n=1 Tax=Pontivivens ytuae TaxID=2789856 RepID=A0A7S9LV22_9RHOB|nr:ATP-binding cassette domain-containing protein [Pontivivens ytuae]QPH55639.1 ATP-binding cassette domain-containing protein [Pontivivens ytuae]